MSKNKPTEVGNGLAALLGQPVAHEAPAELPEPVVETDNEQAVRLASAIVAMNLAVDQVVPVAPDLSALEADVQAQEQNYLAAEAIFRQAEKTVAAAQAARDAAMRKLIDARGTNVEQDANAEYIRLQIEERAKKAEEQHIRFEAAKRSGLFTPDELARLCPSSASPLTEMLQRQKAIEKRARDLATGRK